MRRMAAAELAVEAATAGMKFQTLRSDLAKALFRAALADEAIAIAEQDLAWLNVTTKVVEENYRSGTVRLMDVLTLQNEQSKRVEQLKTDRDNRAQAVRVVNRFEPRPRRRVANVATASRWPDRSRSPQSWSATPLISAPELKTMREEIKSG